MSMFEIHGLNNILFSVRMKYQKIRYFRGCLRTTARAADHVVGVETYVEWYGMIWRRDHRLHGHRPALLAHKREVAHRYRSGFSGPQPLMIRTALHLVTSMRVMGRLLAW